MNEIDIKELDETVSAIDLQIAIHKEKLKKLNGFLKIWPNDEKSKSELKIVTRNLDRWKKIRRRAKCRIYNHRYNKTENGKKQRRDYAKLYRLING